MAGTAVHVLTVSDGVAAGVREDRSGALIAERLEALGGRVTRGLVADDVVPIAGAIEAAAARCQVVITTGGTGLTPRDVTPQATRMVLTYEIPGIAEAMRAAGRASTPLADLSRGLVGVVGRALVINLPGSPTGALESLAAAEPILAHAVETLAGPHDHDATRRASAVAYDPPEEGAR
ncbi:MAG: MogA/MoaB family molybdenum cofactor biosynthesis protein [Chloroflexi bacterium]|nr:MogA/MoaB family molybdenum cofactor biosynthesis protein [Chloroflexota bacterium]